MKFTKWIVLALTVKQEVDDLNNFLKNKNLTTIDDGLFGTFDRSTTNPTLNKVLDMYFHDKQNKYSVGSMGNFFSFDMLFERMVPRLKDEVIDFRV